MLKHFRKSRKSNPSRRTRRSESAALPRVCKRRLFLEGLEDRRLLAAGALDPSFGDDGKVLTDVKAFERAPDAGFDVYSYQSNGKSIVVGQKQWYDDDGRDRLDATLTRFGADGHLDLSFGSDGVVRLDFGSMRSRLYGVTVDSQGRIVVAGVSDQGATNGNDFAIARLTPDGVLDNAFGNGGTKTIDFGESNDVARDVAVDSMDRPVLAGHSRLGPDAGYENEFSIARLTESGSLDSDFGTDGKQLIDFGNTLDVAVNLELDSQDRPVIGGYSLQGGAKGYDFAIARLTLEGQLDPNFGTGGTQTVDFGGVSDFGTGLEIDGEGRIVVVGSSYQGKATRDDFAAARLTPDGVLDNSFGDSGLQTIDFDGSWDYGRSVVIDGQNRVLIGGQVEPSFWEKRFAVVRLTEAGIVDNGFGNQGSQLVDFGTGSRHMRFGSLAMDGQNRIVVAGWVYNDETQSDFAIARLDATGALDLDFGIDGKRTLAIGWPSNNFGTDVTVVQPDGKLIVAGTSRERLRWAWRRDMTLTRYNPDGSVDSSFGADGSVRIDFGNHDFDVAHSVALDSAGRIVVGGFTRYSIYRNFAVARLTPDGALDTSFGGDGKQIVDFGASYSANATVNDLLIDDQDRILLGGNSGGKFAVARLTEEGILDNSFGVDGKQTIETHNGGIASGLALDSQNRIILGGYSYIANSSGYDFSVVRLTSTGFPDTSFDADGLQTIDFGGESDFGRDIVVDDHDRILISGSSRQGEATGDDFAIARLIEDGSLDLSFGDGGMQTVDFGGTNDFGQAMTLDSRGGVIVAGYSEQGGSTGSDFAVARLHADGMLDGGFDNDGKQTIDFGTLRDEGNGVTVDSQDRVIIVGRAGSYPQSDIALARLLSNAPPVADAGGPYTVPEGGSIQLDASATTDSSQSTTSLSYQWDLDGDGVFGETGTTAERGDEVGIAPTFSATDFEQAATLNVSLKVTDDGGLTDTATAMVNVLNVVDLAGRTFDDLDNDGVFDAEDIGLDGVLMQLVRESDGVIVASTSTSSDGSYGFDLADLGLEADVYTIRKNSQPADLLDGKESTGDLGGVAADNGIVINTADSNAITGIVIGQPGTQSDTAGYDFAEIQPSSLQSLVWEDFDDDGGVDFGEKAIAGTEVVLSGIDDRGDVLIAQLSDDQGIVEFADLRPGTYTLSESQPSGFIDGKDVVGQVNGVLAGDNDGGMPALSTINDAFTSISLQMPGSVGINYNFGERIDGGQLSTGQTAGIGFWQNRNGQELLESLNGSADSTLLAEYLAGTFLNMYGSLADADGDGDSGDYMTNSNVADLYQHLFKRNGRTAPSGPAKLDAQVMATAFATYLTKQSYAEIAFDDAGNHTVDSSQIQTVESYGFTVTTGGVGSTFVNVDDSGQAFGVADGSEAQVIDLLLAVNERSTADLLFDTNGDGVVDDSEAVDRVMADELFSLINEAD